MARKSTGERCTGADGPGDEQLDDDADDEDADDSEAADAPVEARHDVAACRSRDNEHTAAAGSRSSSPCERDF